MSTVLYQLKTELSPLVGMAYLITSEDRVVLVDGGMSQKESELILHWLQKVTGEEQPTVDAWFITHPHLDHTLACQEMALHYADRITVKRMIYNFPDAEFIAAVQPVVGREIPVFEEALKNFQQMEKITPVTGDRFSFGSADFEILFTWEDLPSQSEARVTMNDSSTVIRMSAEGQTVLFLGDVQKAADDVMIKRYGRALKSDVCQVAHHGCFASTSEFYDYVDPEILLWPCDTHAFPGGIYMAEADRHLIRDMRVKDIVLAGHGTRRMTLPLRPCVAPFAPDCPAEIKPAAGKVKIPRVQKAPAFTDEAWEQAPVYPLNPAKENYSPEVGGEARFLYTEEALFMKISFRKAVLPSNPLRHGTADCNNVRLYFSQTPVFAYSKTWREVEAEGGYANVKFYPEKKLIDGKEVTNTHPALCENITVSFDGGYTMMASIRFAEIPKRGDLISVNLEVTAVDRPDGGRTVTMYLVEYYEGDGCYQTPANMAIAELL